MSSDEENVTIVYCNGEGDDAGYIEHPKVYLIVKIGEEVSCPYCSKVFTFNAHD